MNQRNAFGRRQNRRIAAVVGHGLVFATVVVVATVLLSAGAAADSPEPITECTVIDESGVYELQNDVSSGGTCFEIEADDVVLDGQGYTVTGGNDGDSLTYVIRAGEENNTITNVDINGTSDYGISISVDSPTISDVTLDGSDTTGEVTGILSDSAGDITIRNVELVDYRDGIELNNVDGFTVEAVSAKATTGHTIEISQSGDGIVRDTVASGGGSDAYPGTINVNDRGIWSSPSNVTLDNVTAKGNNDGIHVESGDVSGISITNSAAIGNFRSGIVLHATDVEVTDSRVLDNNEYGILLADGSDTTITDVQTRGNAENALRVDGSPDVSVESLDIGDSTAPNTTLSIAEATDVELGSTAAPEDSPTELASIHRYFQAEALTEESNLSVSVQYEDADVAHVEESTLSLWNHDGEWNEYEGTTVDTDEQSISGTIEEFSTVGVFGEDGDEESPVFEVTEVTLSDEDVEEGTDVSINATVENTGNAAGEYTAELEIDGSVESNTTIRLDSGEAETVEFTYTFEDAGDYEVTVGDVTRTVTVSSTGHSAEFEVRDLTPSIEIDDPGDDATISATIENTGDGTDTQNIEVRVDGILVHEEAVTLDPGESHTFSVDLDTTGLNHGTTYEYSVSTDNDSKVGPLTVAEETADDDDADDDDDDLLSENDGSGFGIGAAVVALLAVAVLLRK